MVLGKLLPGSPSPETGHREWSLQGTGDECLRHVHTARKGVIGVFIFVLSVRILYFPGRSQEQPTVNREGLAGFPGLNCAVLGRNSRGCSVTFGAAS